MEEKEEKKVYRAAIFRIGVEIDKDKPLQDRLKKAREAFLPILVVGTKQEWAKEKDNLLEHFAESEFCEVDASTAAKLASAALPRFQKLGLFDLTVDHILNLSEDLASGTWRMNHPAIVMNYDQLTYLHNLFMSEMIPGTGGRLGYMATWKLLQSFVPGVTYHQATRAVRHFADASSVNFDQFVRILVFFLKNIDENDKEAGLAIDYVLRGEKDMGMQSTGAILIRMYEDLLDKDDASYEAFKQIYTQSTISNDTVAKIKECLLRPRALKKFSKKAQEPERACSFGDGSTQDQRVQRETMVVVDIDQIRYDGKTNNTPVRVLIGVCGEEEKTDFYNAPKGIDVLVAQRKTLKVTFKFTTTWTSDALIQLASRYIELTVQTNANEHWNKVYVPIIPLLFRTPRPIVFRSIFTSTGKAEACEQIQGWFKVHTRHNFVFQRDFRCVKAKDSRKIPLYRRYFSDCLSFWILSTNKDASLRALIAKCCASLNDDWFLVCGNTDFQPEYCLAYRTKNEGQVPDRPPEAGDRPPEAGDRPPEAGEAEMLDVNLSKQPNRCPQVIQKVGYKIAVWRLCPRHGDQKLSYMSTVDPNTRVDVVCKVSDIKNGSTNQFRGYMNIQESMNLFEIQWDLEDKSSWFEIRGSCGQPDIQPQGRHREQTTRERNPPKLKP